MLFVVVWCGCLLLFVSGSKFCSCVCCLLNCVCCRCLLKFVVCCRGLLKFVV